VSKPPTGEITFFFTDIQGSIAMWERGARRMQLALMRPDRILKDVIKSHGGYVFKMVGDAFCAAFPTAVDALPMTLEGAASHALGERTEV
jgi:class 3 adenylate cyclase